MIGSSVPTQRRRPRRPHRSRRRRSRARRLRRCRRQHPVAPFHRVRDHIAIGVEVEKVRDHIAIGVAGESGRADLGRVWDTITIGIKVEVVRKPSPSVSMGSLPTCGSPFVDLECRRCPNLGRGSRECHRRRRLRIRPRLRWYRHRNRSTSPPVSTGRCSRVGLIVDPRWRATPSSLESSAPTVWSGPVRREQPCPCLNRMPR